MSAPNMFSPTSTRLMPFHLPLINTLVLLLSGCAVTWAHHALVHDNDRKALIQGLAIGIVLGIFFTFLQAFEYYELLAHEGWKFGDGSVLLELLHGNRFPRLPRHLIGTIFLSVCLARATARVTSPPNSTSVSRPPPGTGTLLTSSGCSYSSPSTSGAQAPVL